MGYGAASIAPSPLNSPDPVGITYGVGGPAGTPSAFGAVASPPPPSSSTATTGTSVTSLHTLATSTGGETRSYNASMGVSLAYTPSISSASDPQLPDYQAVYHAPVSPTPTEYPAYPSQATYVPQTSPGPRYGGS